MKIKLKEGSFVEITDSNGNTIAKVSAGDAATLYVSGSLSASGRIYSEADAEIEGSAQVNNNLKVLRDTEIIGNLKVNGNLTGNSIIENMSGYSYIPASKENANITYTYIGSVKNGNKVTFACSGYFSRSGDLTGGNCSLIRFTFPNSIGAKLYQTEIGGISGLAFGKMDFCKSYATHVDIPMVVMKESNSQFIITMYDLNNKTEINTSYLFRFEITFLLSDNLASN